MIVIRTHPLEDAALVAEALPDEECIHAPDERQVRVALREADLAIFGYRGRFLREHLAELSRVIRDFALSATILVTDRAPRVARLTASLQLGAILWYERLPELPNTLADVRLYHALERMAQAVERSNLPPKLRAALALALRRANDRPFLTLRALAKAVGCAPVTLRQEFRAVAPEGYTAVHFLEALVVLRAHHLSRTALPWKAIYPEFGWSRRAFERMLKHWPGIGCKDLAATASHDLLLRFVNERLDPILNRRAPG